MAGMIDLEGLILKHYARPFAWGVSDCARCAAAVLQEAGFPDYSAHWQGSSEAEAQRFIAAQGDLASTVGQALEADGWQPAEGGAATPLSIGVLDFDGLAAVALRTQTAWVSRGPRGMVLSFRAADFAWIPPELPCRG